MNSLWQHPFVNVFKHFDVGSFKKSAREGEVAACMDKIIKCTVWRITGVIPANNYIQIPKTGTQSLGLTGRYVYIAFKPLPDRYFVNHMDVVSSDGLVIRISISNLFKEFKSTSTWLQFPFVVSPAGDSLEHQTVKLDKRASSVQPGVSPSTTRWTLLVLDMQYILSIYLNRQFSYVKSIRLCANSLYKGVYTSDHYYQPVRETPLAENSNDYLPRELSFPVSKSDSWSEKYDIIRFPCNTEPRVERFKQADSEKFKQKTQIRDKLKQKHLDSARNKKTRFEADRSVLPETGLDNPELIETTAVKHQDSGRVVFAPIETSNITNEVRMIKSTNQAAAERKSSNRKSAVRNSSNHGGELSKKLSDMSVASEDIAEREIGERKMMTNKPHYASLQPDPMMRLRSVIGLSPSGKYSLPAHWSSGGNNIVYTSHALIISLHISTSRQRHFIGHTSRITALSVTQDTALISSAQSENCSIRLWNYKTADCLSVYKVNGSSINGLSFSDSGSLLVGHGKDTHGKSLVLVWDTSRINRGGEINLISKAHTDIDILSMKVSPADDYRFVSCGRSNIRVWRLKENSLRSAAVPLADQQTCEFSDICWNYEPTSSSLINKTSPDERRVYACSRSGHILEIDHSKMLIKEVHKLLPRLNPKTNDKSTYNTGPGISIDAIYSNDTFVITGSSDGFLRVWPLDFKHVYLEAEHDSPVTSVQMSDNGLKILAATSTGNLGVLDVTTRSYSTLMRSHTGRVLHSSMDALRRHLVTVSEDSTIRVWCLDTLQQLYDFHSASDTPVCVTYHPTCQIFAAGFSSGAVRVFDICNTTLLADLCSHKSMITGLVYSPTADRLYSASSDSSLACYDTSDDNYTVLRLLGGVISSGDIYSPHSLSLSPHGELLAFIGPQPFTVTVVSSRTLNDCMRIDITSVTGPVQAARGLVEQALIVYFTPTNPGHILVVTDQCRILKLNCKTGSLVGEIGNVHRQIVSSVCVTRDGKQLITSGDRGLIKVWDYEMRLDMNFQVYIGHIDPVNRLMFTPDGKNLISCGEAIFIWDYLSQHSALEREEYEPAQQQDGVSLREEVNKSFNRDSPISSRQRSYPQPTSLNASRDHTNDVMSDTETPRDVAPHPVTPRSYHTSPQINLTPAEYRTSPQINQRSLVKTTDDHRSDTLVFKSAYSSPSKSPKKPRPSSVITVPPPRAFKHFAAREKSSCFAQKRYVAPSDQAGLTLISCMGYNGNGRDNLIWQPETGLFVYTSGCMVIIEDLKTGEQKHLIGHTEEISTLAVQSDCQEIASASGPRGLSPGQLCIWELSTMSCRKIMNDHGSNIVSMSYSRDDRFLVSLGDYKERRLCVWETTSCNLVASTLLSQPIHHVAWDPQACNEFVTVGADAAVMFWLLDELSGPGISLRVQEPRVPPELIERPSERLTDTPCLSPEFTCAAYASDRMLYVGSTDGRVSAWETKKNTCVLHWTAGQGEITSIVARRGQLVTASKNSTLRLWSLAGLAELALPNSGITASHTQIEIESEINLDGTAVISMIFDDTLDMGVVGTDVGSLWYINWSENSSVRLVTTNLSYINSISFLPGNQVTGSRLCTCSDDGSLRIWSLEDREQVLQFQVLDERCICCSPAPDADTGHIEGRDLRPTFNTALLSAGYSDGTVRVFDLHKTEMVMKIQPHRCSITSIIYAHSGLLISGDVDGFIALTSTLTGMTTRIINDHKGVPVTNLDIANWRGQEHPRVWLACSADRRVSVWEADWSKDVCQLSDWLTFPAPSFGPDGQRLSKVGGKAYYSSLPPSIARFSLTERDIVVYTGYGLNKSIQFYNLKLKQTIRSIPLTNWATTLDLSSDGQLIATGINERLVKLHDYYEGTFQDYIGCDDVISSVKFSPNGRVLISATDKTLLMWRVNV